MVKTSVEKDLSDYTDNKKLNNYSDLVYGKDEPPILTRYYTAYSLLPSLKDKVVLDVPCGIGVQARQAITEAKAKKVIAIEIIKEQIDYSKSEDKKQGIAADQIEYHVHDCKIPQRLASELADICMCIHLLCFANNYQELVDMARCIYLNLKPGAECIILICSLNKDHEKAQKFSTFNNDNLSFGPWENNPEQPRHLSYSNNDFKFDSWIWDYDTVSKALQQAGFTAVSLHPYRKDPAYQGKADLDLYLEAVEGKIVKAVK